MYNIRKSITGEPNITIQDGTNTLLVGCNIEGNSYQEETPTPDNPQEVEVIEGQNLFSDSFNNLRSNLSYDSNTGIYATSDGDTATFLQYKIQQWSGTSGSTFISGTQINKSISSTGIISFTGTIVNNAQYIRIGNNGASVEFSLLIPISQTGLKVGDTFTLSLELTDITIGSTKFKNVQIVKGSQTLPYTPYNNIGVNVVGKNLLPFINQDFTLNNLHYWVDNGSLYVNGTSTGETATTNSNFKNNFNFTLPAGTYTIKGNSILGTYLKYYDNDTNVFSNPNYVGATGRTFTIPQTTKFYIGFYIYQFSTTNLNTTLMLEKNSTATDYTPYSNITTPIDLQNNFIGKIGSIKDELSLDDLGNVILTKRIGKVVLDGTETNWSDWGITQTSTIGARLSNVPYLINIGNTDTSNVVVSNYFTKTTNQDALYSQDNEGFATTEGNLYFRIKKTTASSLANFKTWLSTHNTIVYYVLETPYQVNLGKANIELNEGVNYITFLTGLDTRNTIEYGADTTAFREQSYSGESLYKADLRIYHNEEENIIDMEQIARITIKDPIIDTTSSVFYLGSFIAKSITIKFKNLDGIYITSGDKVTLQIAQTINNEDIYIPIGEFYVDDLAENYQTTCEIVCNDASIKFKRAVDYSSCFGDDDKATIDEILQEICRLCEVPIGRYPSINGDIEIGVFDGSVSGKQWISYIAELKGCNAKIDRYGRLSLIPLKQSSKVAINALESKSWDLGEKYSISQVRYYNGNIWYEYPSEPENNNNILYIRNDNPFINLDTTLENIYDIVGDCEIYNVKTQNYGDITLDAYDNITYNLGEDSYQTLNDNTIVYEMSVMATIENKITTKQQETTTNVVAGSKDTQLKMIKTNVDLVNATLTTTAEEVQKINQKFDGYVTTGTFNTLQNTVNNIQTSTYTKTEVSQILKGEYTDEQGNPVQVTKAVTESGTFSDEGLRIQKEDENNNVISKTSGLFNELGVDIERTSDGQNVLYAGMVDENDTRFAGYENQTIVGAENVIVKTYLVIGENSRFQDYTDENNNKGTGCFDIGG